MSVCERCTENGNCAWQNHDETICREKPAFPITNADRIRSMTDEELAEWLDRLITHCNDGPCFNCFMQKACLTSMLDWLKQEAEE